MGSSNGFNNAQNLRDVVSLRNGHLAGDGVVDDTAALRTAYALADARKCPLLIPSNFTARITSQLVWNKGVDVLGESNETSIIKKDGNFTGIAISAGGQQSRYEDFTITAVNDAAGHGIQISSLATKFNMQRVASAYNGGHGIYLMYASNWTAAGTFREIQSAHNGGDGIRIDQVAGVPFTSCRFDTIDCIANGGWGFNIVQGDAHEGSHIFLQQNTSGGLQIQTGVTNKFDLYCEANVGPALVLTAASTRNLIIIVSMTTGATQTQDNGTNNMLLAMSGDFAGNMSMVGFSRARPGTNVAGRSLVVAGGSAGTGAVGASGGPLYLVGGEAAGNAGAATGGLVELAGGAGINGGLAGNVNIQKLSDSGVTYGGGASPPIPGVSVAFDFQSTTRVPLMPRLTTAQKNALTAVNGMIVYDTSLAKMQIYEAGAWASIV